MHMNSDALRGLLRRSISVAAWTMIAFACIGVGFGTIPALYLLTSGQAQPGDLLPDGRLMTTAEYTQELITGLVLIALGFGIKTLARRLLRH